MQSLPRLAKLRELHFSGECRTWQCSRRSLRAIYRHRSRHRARQSRGVSDRAAVHALESVGSEWLRDHHRCVDSRCDKFHSTLLTQQLFLDEATRAIANHVRGLRRLNLSICVSLRDSTVIEEIVRHNASLTFLSLSGVKWCVSIDRCGVYVSVCMCVYSPHSLASLNDALVTVIAESCPRLEYVSTAAPHQCDANTPLLTRATVVPR